jgi:acyl-CoA thioesterase
MTDLPGDANQAEHAHISTALEVEAVNVNLFHSKTLWVPKRARGVFSGQVISQALVSATNCVDKAYGLHVSDLQCLISADRVTIIDSD